RACRRSSRPRAREAARRVSAASTRAWTRSSQGSERIRRERAAVLPRKRDPTSFVCVAFAFADHAAELRRRARATPSASGDPNAESLPERETIQIENVVEDRAVGPEPAVQGAIARTRTAFFRRASCLATIARRDARNGGADERRAPRVEPFPTRVRRRSRRPPPPGDQPCCRDPLHPGRRKR